MFFENLGKTEGKCEALFTVLAARGMTPSTEEREVITACTDATVLDRWIARAVTASAVAEVLGPSPH